MFKKINQIKGTKDKKSFIEKIKIYNQMVIIKAVSFTLSLLILLTNLIKKSYE